MKIKLTDTCLYEGVVKEGDMEFLENCRMNGKREMIMLQMAGLMGSEDAHCFFRPYFTEV
jgi:hypothetical protein